MIRAWVCLRGLSLASDMQYSSASRVGLDVRESIANTGMRYNFGILQLSGKPGGKRKYCNVSRKELVARGCESGRFPVVSPGVLTAEGETHMDRMSSCIIYTLVIIIS